MPYVGLRLTVITTIIITTTIMMMMMMMMITLFSKNARCVWHKSCHARLACSEHHGLDVSCSTYKSQTKQCLSSLASCSVIGDDCRRLECYRCCVAKPAHAAMVSVQPDAPSHILKVSGLEQQIR